MTNRERTKLYQSASGGEGKPARSGAAMRDALERIRRHQPRGDLAGPLAGGLPGDDWLALAAFYDPAEAERLQAMLGAAGVAVRIERERRLRKVLVRVVDRDRARPIVFAHAAGSRDSSSWRKDRSLSRKKVAIKQAPVARPACRAPRRPSDPLVWRLQRSAAWNSIGCICGAAFGPNLAALALWAAYGPTSAFAFLFVGLLGITLGAWAGKAFSFLASAIENG